MMENWKEFRFEEIVQFPPKIKMKKGEQYPFIPMEQIDAGIKYVKPKFEKELKGGGAKFEEGDTLFARITPCLENGKIAQAKNLKGKPGFGSTEYFVFRGMKDISDSDFIYYLSKSYLFRQNAINSMVGASGRQRADAGFVKRLKVSFPPLPTQRKIAAILSAYDDLIENNLRRIKLLEEMAQLTYEEWFVRMKFPGHETTDVDKETGLPVGWELKRLNEIAKINSSSVKNGFEGIIKYVDIAGVSPGRINSTTEYNYNEAPGRAKRIVKHGDIIWSCVRPNRRSHTIIWNPEENLIASTGFCVISPEHVPSSYLLQIVKSNSFVGYLTNRAGGAAYPAVKAVDFKEAEIVVPSKKVVAEYDKVFKNSLEISWNLQNQNQLLKEARDLLLPRLMTGMIDVEQIKGPAIKESEE